MRRGRASQLRAFLRGIVPGGFACERPAPPTRGGCFESDFDRKNKLRRLKGPRPLTDAGGPRGGAGLSGLGVSFPGSSPLPSTDRTFSLSDTRQARSASKAAARVDVLVMSSGGRTGVLGQSVHTPHTPTLNTQRAQCVPAAAFTAVWKLFSAYREAVRNFDAVFLLIKIVSNYKRLSFCCGSSQPPLAY